MSYLNHYINHCTLFSFSNGTGIELVDYSFACRELLKGPLYYVVMLMLCSLIFWRDSPVGVVSLSMMCGGDGNNY